MSFRFNALACALAAAAVSVLAAPAVRAAGDASLGEKKFYTCFGCHGVENYRNAYPDYSVPKLRHQTAVYIIAALQEYRSGERPHATMHAQAASLSDQDMDDIAAYLQGPEPAKPTPVVAGTTPPQAAACTACHGVNGSGVDAPLDPKPPVLAGQYADYLEQAIGQYRSGRRKNAIMTGMTQSLTTDADVKAVAAYFSAQNSSLLNAKTNNK
jgi:cytochrome c553